MQRRHNNTWHIRKNKSPVYENIISPWHLIRLHFNIVITSTTNVQKSADIDRLVLVEGHYTKVSYKRSLDNSIPRIRTQDAICGYFYKANVAK